MEGKFKKPWLLKYLFKILDFFISTPWKGSFLEQYLAVLISLFIVTRIRTMKAAIIHQNNSINRINPSFPAKYLNNAQLILSLYGDSNFNVVFVNQLLARLCDLKTFGFKIQSKGEDCDDHQLREMSSDVINAHNHLFVLS